MVKLRYNTLIIKSSILLCLLVFVAFSLTNAQSPADTNCIQSLYDSAKVYYRNADYKIAEQYFIRILSLKKELSEDVNPEYFKVYNWLGLINHKQGHLHEALKNYNYALKNTSDNYYITFINDNLANTYSLKGDYSKAISYLENSLFILEKISKTGKYHDIVDNYNNQGYAYYKSGQIELALKKSLKGMKVAYENHVKITGNKYYNIGLMYQYLDSLNNADFYFKKAIKSFTEEYGANHYMTGIAYMNHAGFYADIGNYEKSKELYKKSLSILMNTLGAKHIYTSYCLKHYGNLYFKKGNYTRALKYYQRSLIAKIQEFNDTSVFSSPEKDTYPDLDLLDVLNAKAQAFEKLEEQNNKEKNLKAALSTLELTVDFVEQLRAGYLYESSKLKLAENEHNAYMAIVRIAYLLYEMSGNSHYVEMAFKYSEKSKYAVLRGLINEETAKMVAGIPESIQKEEHGLREQIGSLRMQIEEENGLKTPSPDKIESLKSRLFELAQQRDSIIQKLEDEYPAYYKKKFDNSVITTTQLVNSMNGSQAVLEYVVNNSSLYTFAITKDTVVFSRQSADSTFYAYLNDYIASTHSQYSSSYYRYRETSYGLYSKLVKPFETFIKNKHILIIPDEKLNLVAFESFITRPYSKTDSPDYRNEHYLLRDYPIAYAYNATIYANTLVGKRKGSPEYLGVAPSYINSRDSLRHIPEGLKSVRKLALFTFGKSLVGDKATEENFREYCRGYDIIQFYAHGIDDTINPGYSKIFLYAPSDTVDGYLHAWEVYNMKLNAGLIILGSCYSGSGKLAKGEGVMSISRSFIYAGARSVILSLWFASGATNEILNNFYMNLLKGMRKDEALRRAKLSYLENTDNIQSHPRFWASLILNGNQDALYKNWYLKKILALITIIGLAVLIIKKRKSLHKLF